MSVVLLSSKISVEAAVLYILNGLLLFIIPPPKNVPPDVIEILNVHDWLNTQLPILKLIGVDILKMFD
jgi:hypothetical protein